MKLTAITIGRSRETQTKEFDQARSKLGSTVFENKRKDSIRTISLSRIKAREGMENEVKFILLARCQKSREGLELVRF